VASPQRISSIFAGIAAEKIKVRVIVCLSEKWEKGKPILSLLLVLLHA
jgi:hypothetical protein